MGTNDLPRTPGGSTVAHARRLGNPDPDRLEPVQRAALLAHLEQHLGKSTGAFVELISEYVCLDLVVFAATPERRFIVVCTLGCSARAMAVPQNMQTFAHQEFLVCVPPEWPFPGSAEMDDAHWWPFKVLKDVPRLAHSARTFAAPATTIPKGDPAQPYAHESLLTTAMVWTPIGLPAGLAECNAAGLSVRISQIIALTTPECDMKLNVGVDDAMTLLAEYAPDFAVMDPLRGCAATKFVARLKGEDGFADSFATRPGGISLSEQRLREWVPELFTHDVLPAPFTRFYGKTPCTKLIKNLSDHLSEGDAQPAVVVRLDPLVIAAHTDELDCVALLLVDKEREQSLIARHGLKPGSRLMAVNCYYQKGSSLDQDDVIQGPKARGIYGAFYPLIADFLTDDADQLARMKARIEDKEWQDVERKSKFLVERKGWIVRTAHPLLSLLPGQSTTDRSAATNRPAPATRPAPGRAATATQSDSKSSGLPGWAWTLIVLGVIGVVRLLMRG